MDMAITDLLKSLKFGKNYNLYGTRLGTTLFRNRTITKSYVIAEVYVSDEGMISIFMKDGNRCTISNNNNILTFLNSSHVEINEKYVNDILWKVDKVKVSGEI